MDATAPEFHDEEAARDLVEEMRWPDGIVCPRCGNDGGRGSIGRVEVKSSTRRLYKCYAKDCRRQFSLTTGTIFEDSHIPIHKWLLAIYRMCASKKGVSAFQLHRELGITPKSAWFVAHRIRYAMADPTIAGLLGGTVEMDETYIGPKRVRGKRGRGAGRKVPVVSLVERGGQARSQVMKSVTTKNVRAALRKNVEADASIMTDGLAVYRFAGQDYHHETVNHSIGEYVRGSASTNTVESFFALLKRGVVGTFHHVSERHLPRYLAEFDFRYGTRKTTDGERMRALLSQIEGKRLKYREAI